MIFKFRPFRINVLPLTKVLNVVSVSNRKDFLIQAKLLTSYHCYEIQINRYIAITLTYVQQSIFLSDPLYLALFMFSCFNSPKSNPTYNFNIITLKWVRLLWLILVYANLERNIFHGRDMHEN